MLMMMIVWRESERMLIDGVAVRVFLLLFFFLSEDGVERRKVKNVQWSGGIVSGRGQSQMLKINGDLMADKFDEGCCC
jgi:hypothetical protein